MKHSNITVSSGKLQFAELIKAHFYTPFGVPCEHPLPPLWERWPSAASARRGEVPGNTSCLSPWERWPTQRVPEGEKYPKYLASPLGRGGRAQRVPEGEKYLIHLASPLGEVAERSECPKGRSTREYILPPPWERWPSAASARGEKYPGISCLPLGRGGRAQGTKPMTIPKDNTQLENARRLRREMTPHERKL